MGFRGKTRKRKKKGGNAKSKRRKRKDKGKMGSITEKKCKKGKIKSWYSKK
jgi:hypothetical protein